MRTIDDELNPPNLCQRRVRHEFATRGKLFSGMIDSQSPVGNGLPGNRQIPLFSIFKLRCK
ncbi:hypothetical protein D1AOALGA4SA_6845 [Olavius algarvensis Delta 1 endosymbiont]|nr:hypothetical protein D1AOALGA4SA_6845 [Olavius algarvensis Delta 1 endosymbiont]